MYTEPKVMLLNDKQGRAYTKVYLYETPTRQTNEYLTSIGLYYREGLTAKARKAVAVYTNGSQDKNGKWVPGGHIKDKGKVLLALDKLQKVTTPKDTVRGVHPAELPSIPDGRLVELESMIAKMREALAALEK